MPRARRLTILVLILVFVLGVFLIIVGYGWFLQKQERVAHGVANPKFPYRDYTTEELNTMYPQYLNVDVPTTQTPEETHQLFLSALKAGDIDKAVECCFFKEDWESRKEFLKMVSTKGMYNLMVSDLSKIEKDYLGDVTASYKYSGTLNNNKTLNIMSFVKDSNGKWLIKSF